jgi:hypothetical protein
VAPANASRGGAGDAGGGTVPLRVRAGGCRARCGHHVHACAGGAGEASTLAPQRDRCG